MAFSPWVFLRIIFNISEAGVKWLDTHRLNIYDIYDHLNLEPKWPLFSMEKALWWEDDLQK